METGYFMVRAMGSTERDFEVFLKNSVVAVGWSDVDFSAFASNHDQLRGKIFCDYYANANFAPQVIGRKMSQIQRFCEIKEGDRVIIPYYNQILLATATGRLIYSVSDKCVDLSNQQKVIFQYNTGKPKTILRNDLSEALQRRLRVRGSVVADLIEFSQEIDELFLHDSRTYEGAFSGEEHMREERFKTLLLSNICSGKTNLQTGGIGLESLVCELFRHEGYEAEVGSKKRFPGGTDADVEAIKTDQFSEIKILAQVKHHQGISDIHGLNQLLPIKEINEYQDYKLVYVTTGKFSDNVKVEADHRDIILMDGEDLMEWLFTHLDKLNDETKRKLRISSIPQIG